MALLIRVSGSSAKYSFKRCPGELFSSMLSIVVFISRSLLRTLFALIKNLSINKWSVSRGRGKALFYGRSVLLRYSTGVKKRFDEVIDRDTLIYEQALSTPTRPAVWAERAHTVSYWYATLLGRAEGCLRAHGLPSKFLQEILAICACKSCSTVMGIRL